MFFSQRIGEEDFKEADALQQDTPKATSNIDINKLTWPTTKMWVNLLGFLVSLSLCLLGTPEHETHATPSCGMPTKSIPVWAPKCNIPQSQNTQPAQALNPQHKLNLHSHPALHKAWESLPADLKYCHLNSIVALCLGVDMSDLWHALGNIPRNHCLWTIIASNCPANCALSTQ